MKILYYSLLVICLSFATSCVEDLKEQDRPTLSEEELAINYLQYTSQSLLLGKVEIDESGKWVNGWIIDNNGEVKELEFPAKLQPGEANEIEIKQMNDISKQGNFLFEIENTTALVEHVIEIRKIPLGHNLEKITGEAYFGVVSTIESQTNSTTGEIAACGETGSHDDETTLYSVKYLSTAEAELNDSKAKAAVQWLESVNSQLN